jgi:hypothetical protein
MNQKSFELGKSLQIRQHLPGRDSFDSAMVAVSNFIRDDLGFFLGGGFQLAAIPRKSSHSG